jgi:NH3-dependent NAD+ synthetase
MGKKNHKERDRRGFLSLLLSGKDNMQATNQDAPEMVKMLTAEGKLVEINKAVLDEVARKQKATNKEIYDWMKNPSKENN